MHLLPKVIRISCAKFYCNKLATVQDIQDYVSLIIGGHIAYGICVTSTLCLKMRQLGQL